MFLFQKFYVEHSLVECKNIYFKLPFHYICWNFSTKKFITLRSEVEKLDWKEVFVIRSMETSCPKKANLWSKFSSIEWLAAISNDEALKIIHWVRKLVTNNVKMILRFNLSRIFAFIPAHICLHKQSCDFLYIHFWYAFSFKPSANYYVIRRIEI